MLDVNRGEVVEVFDERLSPPDRHLRSSENFVDLPSAQYRGVVAAFVCSSHGVHSLSHGLFAIHCFRAFSLTTE